MQVRKRKMTDDEIYKLIESDTLRVFSSAFPRRENIILERDVTRRDDDREKGVFLVPSNSEVISIEEVLFRGGTSYDSLAPFRKTNNTNTSLLDMKMEGYREHHYTGVIVPPSSVEIRPDPLGIDIVTVIALITHKTFATFHINLEKYIKKHAVGTLAEVFLAEDQYKSTVSTSIGQVDYNLDSLERYVEEKMEVEKELESKWLYANSRKKVWIR